MINLKSIHSVPEVRRKIAEVTDIPLAKIHYNPFIKEVTIQLKRNRHVTLCTHQLERLKREFSCDDIIISSPYRCVIKLKFWNNTDMQCKCRHQRDHI